MKAERTGWVQVTMIDGSVRIVLAQSFGEAASRISCAKAQIKLFEWSPVPVDGIVR